MRHERERGTNEIISRLELLSIETAELLSELQEAQERDRSDTGSNNQQRLAIQPGAGERRRHVRTTPTSNTARLTSSFAHGFEIGDTVVIANNYLRQRNTRGLVVRVTEQRVTIVDSRGITHIRKPTNLRKIQHGQ
jgi:hypothetical protein